jgi:hypothetical protein
MRPENAATGMQLYRCRGIMSATRLIFGRLSARLFLKDLK